MSCKSINIQAGQFSPMNWSQTLTTTLGSVKVTYTPGGANPGISIVIGAVTSFLSQSANESLHYILWGVATNPHLLLLSDQTLGGSSTLTVSLQEFTGTSIVSHLIGTVNSDPQHPLPGVQVSQGSGDAVMVFFATISGVGPVDMMRGDNATVLCSLVGPVNLNVQLVGNADTTKVYIQDGGTVLTSAVFPVGSAKITVPATQPLMFPDVVMGGCPQVPPQETFTIKNNGTDCLIISSVGSVAPYTFVGASPALPATLSPNATCVVTLEFQPGSIGTFNNVALPITTTPPNGDKQITCSGKARQAVTSIQFSSKNIVFATTPLGSSANATLKITNNGETPLSVSFPASLPGSAFQWNSVNQTLQCGAAPISVPIVFTPTVVGSNTALISVTSGASSSPDTVNLSGVGCVARAQISVPATFPAFGNLEQGYRLVRLIHVTNGGNGTLNFTASLSGPDAALFELLPDPSNLGQGIQSAPYSIAPTTACGGGTGTGDGIVAVGFFANATPPKNAAATLTIGNHNATNTTQTQFNLPLNGSIIAAVPVDAVAVIDRSGSMGDAVPGGTKAEAALTASRLLLSLLPSDEDHRFGAVRFNELPDAFLPIAPLTSASRAGMNNALTAANLAPGGSTAIAGGAQTGIDQVRTPRNPAPAVTPRKVVVLLTDGMDNTAWKNPADNKYYTVLGGPSMIPPSTVVNANVLPLPTDCKIYTVGLGKDADIDKAALDALASATHATFRAVDTSDPDIVYQLMKYYTEIYLDIVDMASLLDPKFTINAGDEIELPFDVLRGDVSGMVVMYDIEGIRLPFWLHSPKGEIVDVSSIPPGFAVRSGFTEKSRYLEFKMPVGEPKRYAGTWTLIVQHNKMACTGNPLAGKGHQLGFLPERCAHEYTKPISFGVAIGVGSNFRMQPYVTPQKVYVGDPIWVDAAVAEAGLPVTGCAVTCTVTSPSGTQWDLTLKDDGQHNDGGQNDGEYAETFRFTSQPGSYNFLFRAVGHSHAGEPVTRESTLSKYVWPIGKTPGEPQTQDPCCDRLLALGREQLAILTKLAAELKGK